MLVFLLALVIIGEGIVLIIVLSRTNQMNRKMDGVFTHEGMVPQVPPAPDGTYPSPGTYQQTPDGQHQVSVGYQEGHWCYQESVGQLNPQPVSQAPSSGYFPPPHPSVAPQPVPAPTGNPLPVPPLPTVPAPTGYPVPVPQGRPTPIPPGNGALLPVGYSVPVQSGNPAVPLGYTAPSHRQAPPSAPQAAIQAPVMSYPAPAPHPPAPLYSGQPIGYPQPAPSARNTESKSVESWIGRNVIGVIAAVLVFLGILFLGFLIVPFMGDVIKVGLMYVLSGVLAATGAVLTVRKQNSFTTTLLGCGIVSLFLSIMLTHLYFDLIPLMGALLLLLIWLAGSLALVRIANSITLSIIVHAGMVVSLCFVCLSIVGNDQVGVILVYQVLSVALITVGNILCFKKTYRFGLFVSLCLTLFVSVVLWFHFATAPLPAGASALFVPLTICGVQVLGASFLSYLLFVSVLQVKDKSSALVLQIFNKLLLICVYFVTCLLFVYGIIADVIAPPGNPFIVQATPLHGALAISLVVVLVHTALSVFLGKRAASEHRIESVSIIMVGSYAAILLLNAYFYLSLAAPTSAVVSGLIVLAIAFIIFGRLAKRTLYSMFGFVLLVVDFSIMFVNGYHALYDAGGIVIGLAYMMVFLLALAYQWSRFDEDTKCRTSSAFKVTGLLVFELSIMALFDAARVQGVIALTLVTVIFLIMLVVGFDRGRNASNALWGFLRIHEVLLVVASALYVGSLNSQWVPMRQVTSTDFFAVLLLVASIALLVGTLIRIVAHPRRTWNWLAVGTGIAFTLLMLAVVDRLGLGNQSYLISIALITSALASVIAGFVWQVKPLRLYGLILVVFSVLKMVTFDLGQVESMTRVVAFIIGGLMCFGISALYNYAVKRFDAKQPHGFPLPEED